jgi:hypothetical protein
METSASFEARYAPLLYPTHHVVLEQLHLSGFHGYLALDPLR